MSDVILQHVQKVFSRFTAVHDADFTIRSGEFFTLLGPSGCGKTTTLRMIAGFSFPTSGKIFFGEKDVTTLVPNKRDIGMVFQNYALFPHLSIEENVSFGLKIRKVEKSEQKRRTSLALEKVHLGGYEKRKVHEISGGQQQRVALARALVIEPTILLLDEPLSNLDAKLRDDTRSEIKQLQRELGITTIYVTHDQGEAMAVSDRILILKEGVIQQIGTPCEVYGHPQNRFVAEFIGKHTILPAKVQSVSDGICTAILEGGESVSGYVANSGGGVDFTIGNDLYIAVRPECVWSKGPHEENLITGKVLHAEFTGMCTNYILDVYGHNMKATFTNHLPNFSEIGKNFTVHIPKEHVFFLQREGIQ